MTFARSLEIGFLMASVVLGGIWLGLEAADFLKAKIESPFAALSIACFSGAVGIACFDKLAQRWRKRRPAQAIEARRAETGTGSVEDESAVGYADAPTIPAASAQDPSAASPTVTSEASDGNPPMGTGEQT